MGAPYASGIVIEALYAALVADSTLGGLLAAYAPGFGTGPAVYEEDAVPGGATFPYVTIGAATEVPFNTFGLVDAGGSTCTVQVKVFSRQPNRAELDAIAAAIMGVLDAAPINVTGFGSADCQFEASPGDFTETVGGMRIRQLPLLYRVYVHES